MLVDRLTTNNSTEEHYRAGPDGLGLIQWCIHGMPLPVGHSIAL